MTEASEDKVEKTDYEKARDMITQLKEMGHYAKTNIERLTEVWLALEGELKQKELAGKLELLLTQQNTFHDELETAITEFEAVSERLPGKPAA